MHSLIRYSLAATAVLSMAGGVSARPSAPREGQLGQQNRIERPAAVGGGGGGGAEAKVANAKALYFLTNDEDNAIAAIELGDNGLVTGKGATYQTGGKGANGIDGATNEKAAPDALFSQSALTVAGKHIFAVNAGSNTLSMFAIDPNNPLALQKVGEDIQLPGEFPNTVAASEKNGLVCVGMTGQKAGVACADFSAEGGLGQADGLREFQLNQTTPPVGPTNTVSQVFWSADESQLLATVKGDPEKGNNGFFSAYAVLEADAASAAEDDQSNFVVENNGLNNLNQSDAAQGSQNLEQVKAGKAQDQANKYQNLNASAEAALGGNQYQDQAKAGKEQDAKNGQNQNVDSFKGVNAQEQANKYQNLNASAEAALGGNQYVKAGKAEAEAEAQKAAQDLYKNKNITDPAAAAAAYANAQQQQQEQQQQQQQEGGNQADQAKAGKFRVSQEEIRSTPGGTAVLFGSVAIPGTQDVLATDASFGVAILSLLEGALAGEGGAGQVNLDQNQEQEQRQKEKEQEKEQKTKDKQQQQQQQQQQNEKEQDKQQKEQDKQQQQQDKQQQKQDKQQQKQDKQQQKQDKQQQQEEEQQNEKQQENQQQKQDKQQQQEDQQQEQDKQQQQKDQQQQKKEQQEQQQEQEQEQQQQQDEKQQQKQYAAAARLELPNQKATCWATISPLTNTAFVTDVGRNMLIEVGYNANANGNGNGEGGEQGELSLLNEIDLSSIGGPDLGLIDLRAAGEFVYALSPGAGTGEEAAINVIHAGTKQFVQNARLTGVGAGKNSMGMAVYV